MALFMCFKSSFINSTFGGYFCLGVVQSNNTSMGVRLEGQITIQDNPISGEK